MSISKLYLFSRPTDAPDAQRGFEYQKLKTLQTWLSNKLKGIDEDIFCDYEEDIFQSGALGLKFRQVKLYARNFSFSTEEVHKAIQHFFMLFVKPDYRHSVAEYVFEASSGIAASKGNNEADLFREWKEAQGNLQATLLERCRNMVKNIVKTDIESTYTKRKEIARNESELQHLEEAYRLFTNLDDREWNRFVNSIRWQFEDLSPFTAMEKVNTVIKDLLIELSEKYTVDTKFAEGHLLKIISEKSIQKEGKDRKITGKDLEIALLELGTKKDKWYGEIFAKWSEKKFPQFFNLGEFFEVVAAVRYCRYHSLVINHVFLWEPILNRYISLADLLNAKRKGIYEWFLLVTWSAEMNLRLPPEANSFIREYFTTLSEAESAGDIEDAVAFNQTLRIPPLQKQLEFSVAQLDNWLLEIKSFIHRKLETLRSADSKCTWLAQLGHAQAVATESTTYIEAITEAIKTYEQMLPLLSEAPMYNVSHLSEQLRMTKSFLIQAKGKEYKEVTRQINSFLQRVEPIVQKQQGLHATALKHMEAGNEYMHNKDLESWLEALAEFHKANLLWQSERTIKPAILCSLHIAIVYQHMGLNYAAKYYALTALWNSMHVSTENLDLVAKCYSVLMLADFESGNWMSAILDFEQFVLSHDLFDPNAWQGKEENKNVLNAITKTAMLFFILPHIAPQIMPYVESKKSRLGWLYPEWIAPIIETISPKYEKDQFLAIVAAKLSDKPLNDVQAVRNIQWKTNGHQWNIRFNNDWRTNALAEEFCTVLQFLQTEITRSEVDFHFLETDITIELEMSTSGKYAKAERKSSYSETSYRLFIPELASISDESVQTHYKHITASAFVILNELSLFPSAEWKEKIKDLFENGLADKPLTINAYHHLYKEFFPEERFNERSMYGNLSFTTPQLPRKLNELLPIHKGESSKYNKANAIKHIQNRMEVFQRTMHITIEEWKKDESFIKLVKTLRLEGWLDWQILCALNNYLITQKAQYFLKDGVFPSEKDYEEALRSEMDRLMRTDEAYAMVEVNPPKINDRLFQFYVKQVPYICLHSYGLQLEIAAPPFEAIHNFLVNRFHFFDDDVKENNLLVHV